MSQRSPLWTIACFVLLCLLHLGQANELRQQHTPSPPVQPPTHDNNTTSHLLCTPFGACEPCPPDAINEPFCQPFGNRRLMHCINGTAPDHTQDGGVTGEVPAWETCGRIVPKERADFYEFVACNVAFAAIALGVLFFRSRRLQVDRARQLAARIGLIRGEGGRLLRP
ncbi:hypothetical protein D9619_010675 [Psilocybe cf. subviscida]|uniref:Uncharacterized protein n=1 Tax=Psilocybe cf. subviscida TaxID=2480587 RepID=A0A8H5B882_9AGAR|nr:hypothetical protein D9619_010675 [Psilocybe cf. subviscida]